MKGIRAVSSAVLAAGALFAATPVSAQIFESGHTVVTTDRQIDFEKPAKACLRMCTEVEVERQTFECAPRFAVPHSGCDLPWIDASDPNPDPWGQGLGCVPEKLELDGYHLSERVEIVRKRSRQTGDDCKSEVVETILQTLPDRGNAPRPCPDGGAWVSSSERFRSLRIVDCR